MSPGKEGRGRAEGRCRSIHVQVMRCNRCNVRIFRAKKGVGHGFLLYNINAMP